MPHGAPLLVALLVVVGALRSADGTRNKQVQLHSTSLSRPDEGYAWHVEVVPDDFCAAGAMGRNCGKDGKLKARRGRPMLLHSELVSMANLSPGDAVLAGTINGWGALTNVRLMSLTCNKGVYVWKYDEAALPQPQLFGDTIEEVIAGAYFDVSCPRPVKLRARVALPPWSAVGWSPTSPGFAWWYMSQDSQPRVIFGEDLLSQISEGRAVRAHLFTHRYAKEEVHASIFSDVKQWVENVQDKLNWHSAILLEWDHGRFLTVVELAYLNGIGGYSGKSNWYADKDSPSGTALFRAMPSQLVAPWDAERSELRVNDVPLKTKEEFAAYLKHYSNEADEPLPQEQQRFLNPKFPWRGKSAPVRLYRNGRGDIARYLVNYVRADGEYSMMTRNCQTFAADFYTFLTGDQYTDVKTAPFRLAYTKHTEQFVQEPLRPKS